VNAGAKRQQHVRYQRIVWLSSRREPLARRFATRHTDYADQEEFSMLASLAHSWPCGSLALYYEQSTPTRTDFPDTSSTPTWFGGMISLNAYPQYPPPPSYVRQTTAFADLDGKARYEAGTKYASFLTTMVYIQSEANDQYTDCLVDPSYSTNNIASVTALDEAGAFAMGIYSQEKYGKGQTYNSITGLTQIYGGSWCDLQYKYVDGGTTPRFPAGRKVRLDEERSDNRTPHCTISNNILLVALLIAVLHEIPRSSPGYAR